MKNGIGVGNCITRKKIDPYPHILVKSHVSSIYPIKPYVAAILHTGQILVLSLFTGFSIK